MLTFSLEILRRQRLCLNINYFFINIKFKIFIYNIKFIITMAITIKVIIMVIIIIIISFLIN
jgi:hypothetical protein